MKPTLLYLFSFIICILPDTRCFGLKRILYRLAGAQIAKNVRICSSAKIIGNGNLSIGENTWIGHQVLIISTSIIQIGSNVDIAPRVYIGTGTHEIDIQTPGIAGKGLSKDILIDEGCWLCAGSYILPGSIIGKKSIVGAGAVVNGTFESFSLIAGFPAKIVKSYK